MATTIQNSLNSISAYPIPLNTLQDIAEERGVDIEGVATAEIRTSSQFQLAKADIYYWLSKAPNVSQAGISYSFSDRDRLNFSRQANAIYRKNGEALPIRSFGYKGTRI